MESLSNLFYCLIEKLEPTQLKQLLGFPLLGRLLALPTNIRISWKGLAGTSTLAYYENSLITNKKSFITLTLGPNVIRLYGCNLRTLTKALMLVPGKPF